MTIIQTFALPPPKTLPPPKKAVVSILGWFSSWAELPVPPLVRTSPSRCSRCTTRKRKSKVSFIDSVLTKPGTPVALADLVECQRRAPERGVLGVPSQRRGEACRALQRERGQGRRELVRRGGAELGDGFGGVVGGFLAGIGKGQLDARPACVAEAVPLGALLLGPTDR